MIAQDLTMEPERVKGVLEYYNIAVEEGDRVAYFKLQGDETAFVKKGISGTAYEGFQKGQQVEVVFYRSRQVPQPVRSLSLCDG